MSKINSSANVSNNNQLYLRNQESPIVKTESKAAVKIEAKNNSDSPYATFCSREGIDRATYRKAGLGRGLGHAKVGDDVDFEDERGNRRKGKTLRDCGDYLEVFFEGEVYMVDKKTGRSRGHRKATEAEMAQYQQMQQQQAQEQQRQEQQAEARRDEIKADQRRTDQRKYDIKMSLEKAEQKKIVIKKAENKESVHEFRETVIKQISPEAQKFNQTQSVANKFQINVANTEYETLSATTALQIEEQNEKRRNDLQ